MAGSGLWGKSDEEDAGDHGCDRLPARRAHERCARTAGATPPAPAAPLSPEAAALAAVKPNVAKVKTRPQWLRGPKFVLPESERLAGHHGEARITGVLDVDGKVRFATVTRSTGAPSLDALLLASTEAETYEPAKDADGAAIAIPISVSREVYHYKSDKPGGGLAHYSCDQFVRDMDWWRATYPNAEWKTHELYVMMTGFMIAGAPGASMLEKMKAFSNAEFKTRWEASIETCRTKPKKLFRDVLFG